jgi:Carboxypeptidase regulatory-like domain
VIRHLITGRGSDPQGKVVAGATVKFVLPGGSIATESKTDANGQFSIIRVPVGEYRLAGIGSGLCSDHEEHFASGRFR